MLFLRLCAFALRFLVVTSPAPLTAFLFLRGHHCPCWYWRHFYSPSWVTETQGQ